LNKSAPIAPCAASSPIRCPAWVKTIVETAQWALDLLPDVQRHRGEDPGTKIELMRLCGGQKWVADCPVFLAFCADMNRLDDICQEDGKQVNLEYTETLLAAVLDTGLMMQNAALAAESLGLGMVMIGGLRDHPREIISLLSLPRGVFGVSGMCLGFPEDRAQRPRLPLGECYWERYDPTGRRQQPNTMIQIAAGISAEKWHYPRLDWRS
jgi:nitroreductase